MLLSLILAIACSKSWRPASSDGKRAGNRRQQPVQKTNFDRLPTSLLISRRDSERVVDSYIETVVNPPHLWTPKDKTENPLFF